MNFIIVPPKRKPFTSPVPIFIFHQIITKPILAGNSLIAVRDMFRGICVCFAYLGMFETKLR